MTIDINHVVKRFGSVTVCDHLNLHIPTGELVALLGPSGSGKTTLLRIIAGLEQADEGRVQFDGVDATDLSVQQRNIGFVFQHYALFGHLTIFENIAFGLRVRPKANRPSDAEIESKVQALLKLVQLEGLAQRYPHQLSGGQRQRIALARALAVEPKVLLLDEPFGALDAQVRKELRRWLRQLHHDLNITSVFVTHDQEEAMEVADRIVVMNQGRIEQVGTPDEVYHHPANSFVMQFLGDVHVLTGTHGQDAAESVFVRPHHIKVLNEPEEGAVAVRWVRSLTAGPCATLLFAPINGTEEIEVVLTHDELAALQAQGTLNREAQLYLKPHRLVVVSDKKKPSQAYT